jgi:hypothetical protein
MNLLAACSFVRLSGAPTHVKAASLGSYMVQGRISIGFMYST